MLGHAPPSPIPGQRPHPPLYWLLLWVSAWMLIGLLGHSPWRADEMVQLGLAVDVLDSEHWLAPSLGGQPILETPPWAVWCSALAIRLFVGVMPVHDAARLPGLLALLLAFWALLRWSLPRLQRRDRWAVGLSLFSALSLAIPAHAAASELWTLAAFALLMAALTRPDRRWNRTAALVGAAIALAGLSGGAQALLIAVATLATCGLVLRQRSHQLAQVVGVLAGVVPLAVWLVALQHAVGLDEWARQDPLIALLTQGGRPGGGYSSEMRGVLWSWPLWPLALMALWQRRHAVTINPRLLAPAALLACALLVWWLVPGGPETRVLPALAPLALLAGPGLLALRRGQAQSLYWFGLILFACLVTLLWVYWAGTHLGWPAFAAQRSAKLLPQYASHWQPVAIVTAGLATLGAVAIIVKLRRTPLRPLLAWCTAASVTWTLVMLLGSGWLETARGYAAPMRSLAAQLPTAGCISGSNLSLATIAAVRVYTGHRIAPISANCSWRLATVNRRKPESVVASGQVVWQGRRGADRNEVLVLYKGFTQSRDN